MKKIIAIFLVLISLQCFSQTANDFSSFKPYTGQYGFGMNPGYYQGWTTQNVCKLGYNIGVRNFRMLLYDYLLTDYGYNVFVPDYEYLNSIGIKDLTCMLGGVSSENAWNPFNQTTEWQGVTYQEAHMWKGMYLPIWNADGTVNASNTFADYIFKTISIYGKYIKFWEIVNEPDFTYGDGGWSGDLEPPLSQSWFYRDPAPEELINIRVTVPYYIRLLRVAWEVIKKYQPDSYVCTGGIGNRSFLASLLRNTDNPVNGSVTAEYPLKAGAYFDVISFHDYPEFSPLLRYWDASKGDVVYDRHSDNLVKGHLMIKTRMDSLVKLAGYDGKQMPIKQFITTETGCSRDSISGFGGIIPQLNYILKTHTKTLMDGQIKQMYWFTTADGDGASATDHWGLFGCYYPIAGKDFSSVQLSPQGQALKTITAKLTGKIYDSVVTKSLNIPSSADGGAFKDAIGNYVYVLWAKTTTDMSEDANAVMSLPQCKRTEWNGATSTVSGNISLNATPSFFEPVLIALPIDTTKKPHPVTPHKKYNVKVYDYSGIKLMDKTNIDPVQFEAQLPNRKYFILTYYDNQIMYTKKIFKQ